MHYGARPMRHSTSHVINADDEIATLPTEGQKSALAGTEGTPGNANRYLTYNDPARTNARDPNPHAAGHGSGEGDELTPAAIGAEADLGAGIRAALAGSEGSPGDTNRFITQEDPLLPSDTPLTAHLEDLDPHILRVDEENYNYSISIENGEVNLNYEEA